MSSFDVSFLLTANEDATSRNADNFGDSFILSSLASDPFAHLVSPPPQQPFSQADFPCITDLDMDVKQLLATPLPPSVVPSHNTTVEIPMASLPEEPNIWCEEWEKATLNGNEKVIFPDLFEASSKASIADPLIAPPQQEPSCNIVTDSNGNIDIRDYELSTLSAIFTSPLVDDGMSLEELAARMESNETHLSDASTVEGFEITEYQEPTVTSTSDIKLKTLCRLKRRSSSLSSKSSDSRGLQAVILCPYSPCPYKSNRKNNLKRHITSMHSFKPRGCCGSTFKCTSEYRQHVKSVHPPGKGFVCQLGCIDKKFERRALLDRHIGSVHRIGGIRFRCTECHYSSTHRSNLNRHIEAKHCPTEQAAVQKQRRSNRTKAKLGRSRASGRAEEVDPMMSFARSDDVASKEVTSSVDEDEFFDNLLKMQV